nr:ribonuclease H-like domain-containing protein [Tanacetum cinerariifolium]
MTSSNSQMHNDIMAAGSKERPPMLAPGSHAQWKSRFMRYVDTKHNIELLKKNIYKGPYVMTEVQHEDTPAKDDTARQPGRIVEKTYLNTTPDMKALIVAEQGEAINIQDVKTKCSKNSAQRDKQIQKSLVLIAMTFKKIYTPTNNNLRTSLNTRNKNVDTSLRTRNDRQTGQFGNQKRDSCWEQGNCRKSEKDVAMQDRGCRIQLSAEQSKWLRDIDDEPDEQEFEAHYIYMEKIQEVLHATDETFGPTFDTEPLKNVHLDDDYNVFATKRQNFEQPESINDTYLVEKIDSIVLSWIFMTLSKTLQQPLVVKDPQTAKAACDLIVEILNDNKRTRSIALKEKMRPLKLGDLSIDA